MHCIDRPAEEALRTLGVAYRLLRRDAMTGMSSEAEEHNLVFLGVVGLIDPPHHKGTAIVVPLLAPHILWINLLTDAGPALALGVEPADPGVMTKPPRDPQSRVINRMMWFDICFVGIIMLLGTLGVMDWVLAGGLLPGGNNSIR